MWSGIPDCEDHLWSPLGALLYMNIIPQTFLFKQLLKSISYYFNVTNFMCDNCLHDIIHLNAYVSVFFLLLQPIQSTCVPEQPSLNFSKLEMRAGSSLPFIQGQITIWQPIWQQDDRPNFVIRGGLASLYMKCIIVGHNQGVSIDIAYNGAAILKLCNINDIQKYKNMNVMFLSSICLHITTLSFVF